MILYHVSPQHRPRSLSDIPNKVRLRYFFAPRLGWSVVCPHRPTAGFVPLCMIATAAAAAASSAGATVTGDDARQEADGGEETEEEEEEEFDDDVSELLCMQQGERQTKSSFSVLIEVSAYQLYTVDQFTALDEGSKPLRGSPLMVVVIVGVRVINAINLSTTTWL